MLTFPLIRLKISLIKKYRVISVRNKSYLHIHLYVLYILIPNIDFEIYAMIIEMVKIFTELNERVLLANCKKLPARVPSRAEKLLSLFISKPFSKPMLMFQEETLL